MKEVEEREDGQRAKRIDQRLQPLAGLALASHILAAALCVVQYIPIYYWIGDRGLACRWVQPWFISTTRCPAKTTARSYKPPILASKSEWIQNRSCSWHGIAEKTTLDLHFHLRILTCLLFVHCYMLCEKKILFYASPINKGRLPQVGRLSSSHSRLPFHDGDEKSILAWIHCHALVHLLKNPFCPGSS